MTWYIKILLLLLLLKNEDILCLMYNEKKKITYQQGQTQDFKQAGAEYKEKRKL